MNWRHKQRSRFSLEEIRSALIEANGNATLAANNLNVRPRTFREWVAKEKIDVTKEVRTKCLQGLGLKEKDAISAVLEKLEITGTSRRYSLEDGEIWVKTSKEKETLQQAIASIKEGLCDDLQAIQPIKAPKKFNEDLAVVIPIGDAHIGMFAWHKESGDDFDLEIAERDLCGAFKYLIDQAPPSTKCIIANVGDFLHYSMMEAKTERHGHILSAAGRPQEMIRIGARVLRYCIEYAATKHKIVESINVPGNHESLLAHAINIMLANIYENNDRIVIHDEPTQRHYAQHGKCLFGVVHGHQTKDRDLPSIMATEVPERWGQTKFRTWFRGHHHHDSRVEYNGCTVEQIRTLAASDDYATGGGYLSGRDLKAVLYHAEYGEVGRYICGIDLLREVLK